MEKDVLKKLMVERYAEIALLNAPDEFVSLLSEVPVTVSNDPSGRYGYVQIFITSQKEIADIGKRITDAVDGDGLLWICYPKRSSKRYRADCDRDTLRGSLEMYGFSAVAQFPLSDDWSAVRFRRSGFKGR